MAVSDDDLRKIRLNDLSLPECRETLAGFLAAMLFEMAGIGIKAELLDTAIGIYALAVQTGALEIAQGLQAEGPEAVEAFIAKARRGLKETD